MPDGDDTINDAPRTKLGVGEVRRVQVPELVGKTVLDHYVIEAKLGHGAMGSVFRGRDTRSHEVVAIKVLHAHLVDQPTMIERFRREAKIATRLHHPNLVGVLDMGQTGDYQMIVLELARGPTLRQLMTGPLPAARIVGLVAPILRGLQHAHDAGLIHRDLKPDNVMVDHAPDGTEIPRIVDFGIAALRDPDESSEGGKLTASGMIVGTPLYMAPEQARGEAIDHRIDLFALGIAIYEMLAGIPPFSGSAIEIAIANINAEPPAIAKRVPGLEVDPVMEQLARRLMAKHPGDRFASATAALDVLELVLADPELALLRIGRMDVDKAMAVVSIPG